MRYLGNKETLIENILLLMKQKKLLNKNYKFFDAFCGTGTVSDYVKEYFDIILNDNLKLATTFSNGRILAQTCKFSKLGFNPIEYFNNNHKTKLGFISKNYAPKLSKRMYFSDYNAGRIDYFRSEIEKWYIGKKINIAEYNYLLGCLLESISKVSNVAGVYGAYLKKWDPRAIKKIKFLNIEAIKTKKTPKIINTFNKNINEIISDVDCDILYLDPPYTKNKYSVQYHILETIIKNDNPILKGITGGRKFDKVSDNWSKNLYVHKEFEKVIRETKARHIIISYSSDGLMSKDYITYVLKRYGVKNSFKLVEIPYKKYRNYKTKSTDIHYEYLFYIKKKPLDSVIYCCPLNYMGGKSNIIDQIKPELKGKNKLIDLMGGGFNVGINGRGFKSYVYNDVNYIVKNLIKLFYDCDSVIILEKIESIIRKYKLSKHSQQSYLFLRNEYNTKLKYSKNKYIYLFVLILFGFQQQIRFNSKLEFNNPVGESGYNEQIKEKIISFCSQIKSLNVIFTSLDFEKYSKLIDKNCLVYIDPPYLITLGSYNDGKRGFCGWNYEQERRLIEFIDSIKNKGCKILISNILEYKNKKNDLLYKWIKNNKTDLKYIKIKNRGEVLIKYETNICNK